MKVNKYLAAENHLP